MNLASPDSLFSNHNTRYTLAALLLMTVTGMLPGQHDHAQSQQQDHSRHDTSTASVEQDTAHAEHSSNSGETSGVHGRLPVELDAAQRQLINIRTTPVTEGRALVKVRAVGIVTYNETQIANVNTRIMGWAENLFVDKPGQFVNAGDPLMDIYSPELYSAQTEYLQAYRHCERLGHLDHTEVDSEQPEIWAQSMRDAETLLESARKRLRLWEVTEDEIRALEKSGMPRDTVQLKSPVTGFVIQKGIDPAQMVRPGMTLYRVADLSSVWVNAEIYEYELPLVKEGQQALVTAVAYPGREFKAEVNFIYPYSESRTRTTKVRLALDNSGGLFKPDTYVTVEFLVDLGHHPLIPDTAVFDTGTRQYVFVEEHPGHFIPRSITLGPKVGRQFAITDGLVTGETVVVDGNFLLDSESQLRAAGTGGGHQH